MEDIRMGITFEDLTEEQLLIIFNGVGSDTIPVKPPQLVFGKAALRHDFLYYVGGVEADRLAADKLFLKDALESAGDSLVYKAVAYLYYAALRLLGNKGAFEYGEKAGTWEQILVRVKNCRMQAYNLDRLKSNKTYSRNYNEALATRLYARLRLRLLGWTVLS